MATIRGLGDVLAERVRQYRKAGELRQEDLADRTGQLGRRLSQATLASFEAGGTRAAKASLADVLVLAAALDVPPPLLFLPLGDDEEVEVAPGLVVHPHIALDWVAGDDDLRSAVPWPSVEAWERNALPIRLFRGLRKRQDAVHTAEALDDPVRVDRALEALAAWIDAMAAAGMVTPELPKAWQARIADLEAD